MLLVETSLARMSTERTPSRGGPTATRSDHGLAPFSPRLKATPPPVGRRRLRLMFSNFHLSPRCSSSTIRLPFFRPISLRFWPSRPVRLRLSSQSRPASKPLVAEDDVAGGVIGTGATGIAGALAAGCPGTGAPPPAPVRFEATPVASGLLVSPVDTVT